MAKFVARLDTKSTKTLKKKLKDLKQPIKKKEAVKLGEIILKLMRSLISKGLYPIKGKGRFKAYKDLKKYPKKVRYKYPDKGDRPVNLWLSGDFIKSLDVDTFKFTKGGWGTKIRITGDKNKKKESGHRDGVNGQPKRPIIPSGNEKFAKKIQVKILSFLDKQIGFIVKRRR